MKSPSDLEKAYGLLWTAIGSDPRVQEARQILEGGLTEEEKARGRDYAYARHPSAHHQRDIPRPMLGMTALVLCDDDEQSDKARIALLRTGCRVRRADSEIAFKRHLQVYTPTMVIGQEIPEA